MKLSGVATCNGRGCQLIVEMALTLWLGLSGNHSGEEVTGDEKWRGAVIVQSKVDETWGKLTDIRGGAMMLILR